eukprot:Pgem_evm1s19644
MKPIQNEPIQNEPIQNEPIQNEQSQHFSEESTIPTLSTPRSLSTSILDLAIKGTALGFGISSYIFSTGFFVASQSCSYFLPDEISVPVTSLL